MGTSVRSCFHRAIRACAACFAGKRGVFFVTADYTIVMNAREFDAFFAGGAFREFTYIDIFWYANAVMTHRLPVGCTHAPRRVNATSFV
jgi:hypothetical protein